MPIYEFHCTRCQERFEEILRNLDQAEEVVCPECGSERVDRLQSGFATLGAGSGPGPQSSCGPSSGGFT
ncbi:MAG: zinc ribbon domain-containing protein [Deltaproteobacteria bacterium]|nr:zinc ribbon domain-containing protein [Deltaproteobacteria bacterium]